jgi:hypothetical protein
LLSLSFDLKVPASICKSREVLLSSYFDSLECVPKISSGRYFVEHMFLRSSKLRRPGISAIVGTRIGSTMCTTTTCTSYALTYGSRHKRLVMSYVQFVYRQRCLELQ